MLLHRVSGLLLGVFSIIVLTPADMEVVDTNPDFLGCYKDDKAEDENFRLINPRALGFQIQRFSSVQDCADQCASKGFLYAGLQNGDLCFCGNDFDKYGRAHDSECNIKCRTPDEKIMITDNAFESCGGRWRNAVYAVTGVRAAERAVARKWWAGKK
ncbi:kremen protein 1-like [Acropora millepora]|uniref:kremen protein 1-like n=1 Tax=Acropora millepora TaxID=45264 RepID=UPI001CF528F0|nr:kremen protein 1-like [Acropora millepora]